MFDQTTAAQAAERDLGAIIDRLDGLADADWGLPVRCQGWQVTDLAAHLVAASRGHAEGLRRAAPFEISVAAYPETHPAALSDNHDIDNLKRKIDAGATRAITQYFFDTEVFLRFLDRCAAAGITVPIVPGIMPVSNFTQMRAFSAKIGASVPDWMGALFEGLDNDVETRRMIAAVVAAEQVRLLQANGVDEFHFYTLNRPDLSYAIAHILGVRPAAAAAAGTPAAASGPAEERAAAQAGAEAASTPP